MSEVDTVQLIALAAWLVLAGSALASYRFNWSKALRMVLVWMAIFFGVFFLFQTVKPG